MANGGSLVVKKVLIADDHDLHRSLLKTALLLAGSKLGIDFQILAEAIHGQQLVEHYQKHAPGTIDLVLSDIRMPEMDGLSALVKIKSLNPQQKMVMVSSEDEKRMEAANEAHGEQNRKTLDQSQKWELLAKVAERIRSNTTEPGKTNSILLGCEKLVLDPIWTAQQFGASGYLKKPYQPESTLEVLRAILLEGRSEFISKAS